MSWEDPIVEEVRKARDEYARQFNYDLDAIFRDIQEKQQRRKERGRKVVRLEPREPEARRDETAARS